jgi:flagellar FliL protein
MAEEKEELQPDEGKDVPAKKSNKSLFLIIGILVLALIGGVVAYLLLTGGKGGHPENKKQKQEEKDLKTALIALESFVLNLSDQGRYLKVTMQFELADAANQPLVIEKTPQIRDAIITLVSSKSVESVSSPEGKMQLKDEVLLRANQAVGKDIFKNLYFTEFVMQ